MPALAIVLTLLAQGPSASFTRAESLLVAGDLQAALDTADRLVAQHPSDPSALVLLGRIHFVRPVIGRYPALAAFRAAARLAPADPEPLYWQMKVGFHLGSDEGDVMAREALLRLFALDPDYRDAWRRFGEVYRNPAIWRRAEAALAHHGPHPVALARRAELLIAIGEAARAESLLALLMTHQAPTAATSLLRAEANFLAGAAGETAGYAWHDSAVARADADSTGALWDEVWMIASPDEAARHAATLPGDRRAFFAQFWSRRDPNLVTPENERLPEHFRRLAHVRRFYRLLHPQNAYFRSAKARAMTIMSSRGALADELALNPDLLPAGSADRLPAGHGVGVDPRDIGDTTGRGSQMYAAGVDARGLIYLRHGPPDILIKGTWDPLRPAACNLVCSPLDDEGWLYHTPDGPISIGFRRSTGSVNEDIGPSGDIAFFPVSQRQLEGTRRAIETDRTALPAPLVARGWSAFFKSGALGRTDAYFKAAPGTAAVVLWDKAGSEAVRASGPGFLVLTVPPGRYDYGFDVDSAGVVGRLRGAFTVPGYSAVDLGLSSLVLAPADSLTAREVTIAAMPADLVFDAGAALALYAEVYGLTPDPTGRARYQVRYAFEPVRSLVGRLLRGVTPVAFEFTRDVEQRERVAEQIVLEAGRVPPGRYRVSLAVTDLRRNVKSQSVALEITIR